MGLDELLYLKWENCLILVEFDEKSLFGEEQQSFRPGLKLISKTKSSLLGLKIEIAAEAA